MQQLNYGNWQLETEEQWVGPTALDNDYRIYVGGGARILAATLAERFADSSYVVTAESTHVFSKPSLTKLIRQLLPNASIRTARIVVKE